MTSRRAESVSVHIEPAGLVYECSLDESLLKGMARQGLKGIPVGCVSGGCGVCKVRIIDGSVRALGPLSRAHVSLEEESRGLTLACRVAPRQDVRLKVVEKFEKLLSKGLANSANVVTKP